MPLVRVVGSVAVVPIPGTRRAQVTVSVLPMLDRWPKDGIGITSLVIGQPNYVKRHYGKDAAYVPVAVTDEAGKAELELQFQPKLVFADHLAGTFIVLVHAQGIPATSHWNLTFDSPVKGLEILTPFVPDNGIVNFIDNFQTLYYASIMATNPEAVGSRIELRLLACDGNASICIIDDPNVWQELDPLGIRRKYGRLQVTPWDGRIGLHAPYITNDGFADNLTLSTQGFILGTDPKYVMRVAYAYAGEIIAVERGRFQSVEGNRVTIIHGPPFQASPGQAMRSIKLQITGPQNVPVAATFALTVVADEQRQLVGLQEDGMFAFGQDGIVVFDKLAFIKQSALGTYSLQFLYPGAEPVQSTLIQLSQSAGSISFGGFQPSSGMVGGNTLNYVVRAVLEDGSPVPNALVTCQLVMGKATLAKVFADKVLNGRPYSGCYAPAGQCGRLVPSSARQTTNKAGIAAMNLEVLAAWPGEYYVMCNGQPPTGRNVVQSAQQQRPRTVSQEMAARISFSHPVALQTALDFVLDGSVEDLSLSQRITRPKRSELTILSESLTIRSPVHTVQIVTHPMLYPKGYRYPINFQPQKQITPNITFHKQPKVRVLDRKGNPLTSKKVFAAVFPKLKVMWDDTVVTDSQGYYQFRGLRAASSGGGTYRMVFFVEGMPSETSEEFIVPKPQGVAKQFKNLRYALLCLYAILLALFVVNYPGLSALGMAIWIPLGLGSVAGAGALTYFLYLKDALDGWDTASIWLKIATVYLIVIFALLCLTSLRSVFLAVRGLFVERVMFDLWGLPKAREQYEYAKWILTLRLSQDEYAQQADAELQDPLKIFHKPPPNLTAHIIPVRLYVAMGLCFGLITLFVLFCVWFFLTIERWMQQMSDLFPKLDALTLEQLELAKSRVEIGFIGVMDTLVDVNPAFAFMYRITPLIRSFDLIYTVDLVHQWATSLRRSVTIAGEISVVLCLFFAILNCILIIRSVKTNMLRIRKFKDPPDIREGCNHNTAESYPAHQLFHILLGYMFQFFVFFGIFLVLCTPEIMIWIWKTFSTIIILLIATIIIRLILVQILLVIALDTLEMKHPRWYHLWANFNLVFLSMLAAVTQVIVRFIEVLINVSVFFVRLDVRLFTGLLTKLDAPYNSFHSMLHIENNYHNPIRVVMLAYLLQGRRHWSELHPSIGAMLLVLQERQDFGIRTISKWRRKWWLAVLITQNPCLRRYRKHALWPHTPAPGILDKVRSKVPCLPKPSKVASTHMPPPTKQQRKKEKRKHFILLVIFLVILGGWMALLILLQS